MTKNLMKNFRKSLAHLWADVQACSWGVHISLSLVCNFQPYSFFALIDVTNNKNMIVVCQPKLKTFCCNITKIQTIGCIIFKVVHPLTSPYFTLLY